MFSWYRSGPWFLFFVIPGFLLWFPGMAPTLDVKGEFMGGGLIREWALNNILVPLLNSEQQYQLYDIWESSGPIMERVIYTLVALNIFALALPFLYLSGEGAMRFVNQLRTSTFLKERALFKTNGELR